ncbi:MAG TPA: FAD:protein FMN transferase [Solirubrobacteraceae bacterium]|nr:FAD:protein FMN transferase [Solirubrobacteraceae bacterium]
MCPAPSTLPPSTATPPAARPLAEPPPAAPPRDERLAHASWEALGTSVVLRLTDPRALDRARAAVERELEQIDRACSRFRADSEIVRVNAGGGRAVRVSPLLAEALALALRAAELTAGDVDPTVGTALVLAGYDRDWRLLDPPDARPASATARRGEPAPTPAVEVRIESGWRTVALDRDGRSVRVPAGVTLDLGATAKAWAADRAVRAAARTGGCGALVGVGGDIATSGPAPEGGWRIRVTDDHRSETTAPGQTVSIRSGGLATSSTAVRRWSHAGRTMHHIIDPATGAPVPATWRTVSAAAASCADANIATTAAIVRGATAPDWLEELGLPARLVDEDGRVQTVGDWPRVAEEGRVRSAGETPHATERTR